MKLVSELSADLGNLGKTLDAKSPGVVPTNAELAEDICELSRRIEGLKKGLRLATISIVILSVSIMLSPHGLLWLVLK